MIKFAQKLPVPQLLTRLYQALPALDDSAGSSGNSV